MAPNNNATAPGNVIAVTRLRYNAITGEITDADIAFNNDKTGSTPGNPAGFDYDVANITRPGAVDGIFEDAGAFVPDGGWTRRKDAEATITHEAGHAFAA